jgi:hypothetical protein
MKLNLVFLIFSFNLLLPNTIVSIKYGPMSDSPNLNYRIIPSFNDKLNKRARKVDDRKIVSKTSTKKKGSTLIKNIPLNHTLFVDAHKKLSPQKVNTNFNKTVNFSSNFVNNTNQSKAILRVDPKPALVQTKENVKMRNEAASTIKKPKSHSTSFRACMKSVLSIMIFTLIFI